MLYLCRSRRMWTKRQILIKLRKINLLNSSRCIFETLIVFFFIFFFTLMVMMKVIAYNNEPLRVDQNFIYFEPLSSFFRTEHNKGNIKVDWHDYIAINLEKSRTGPGENGKGIDSVPEDEEELNQRLFDENGYYGLISDKISVNRSVADLRHKDCWKIRYLKDLPTVSVVIPFYNEHLSTLLRTVHSVINRSPPELLKEVILVNDRSTKEFLYDELRTYLSQNFPKNSVRLFELPARSGLIAARLTGARAAIGDVLIFLDSHTEPNTNWLPPLLEPIAVNYRVCTCPFIDVIEFKTFEYVIQDEGSRGVFDWHLNYRKLELQPGKYQHRPTDLFPSPVMAGGLFAISAKFFWELGGYDNKLDIWGGEQYELSFKIWLCGGEMYDVPCSRVGHVYRGSMPFEDDRKGTDFLSINYKRVAEVWMDEYKEYVYMRNPQRYNDVDPGDISYQQSIRKKLQCKPFSYFIEKIAPDMLEYFPLIDYPAFAYGAIQSMFEPEICIDTYAKDTGNELGLYPCASELENPQDNQFFTLRHFRDIELKNTMFCFDRSENGKLLTGICHHHQGNQYFRYDMDTQQIRFGGEMNDECLDMDIEKTEEDAVFLSKCDENSLTQKWKFGFMNETALRTWTVSGFDIYDPYEYRIMRQNGF